jgi:PAS domain S-box-containing protein
MNRPSLGAAAVLQQLIDIIPSPVFVKDWQHRWVLVNDAMETLHQGGREALLGKTDFDFMPADQAESLWWDDEEILATGAAHKRSIKLTNLAGETLLMVTSKTRLETGDSLEARYVAAVINDVTPYCPAEDEPRFAPYKILSPQSRAE